MSKGKAASYTAWDIKDTTTVIPYMIRKVFRTRQAARDWIKKNPSCRVWTPVKIWIQECYEEIS